MTLALARLAADAVLYEGYLLYPYRSTAAKNQVRWQFGVLGPPGAADAGLGEEADLAVECLLDPDTPDDGCSAVTLHLRFLHLQRRLAERTEPDGSFTPVPELRVGTDAWTTWDEAVEVERELGTFDVPALRRGVVLAVEVDGGDEVEQVDGGRLVRRRWPLRAVVTIAADAADRRAPADGGRRVALRLGDRPARRGSRGRRPVPSASVLAGSRRRGRP
jgi:hypothetical protein